MRYCLTALLLFSGCASIPEKTIFVPKPVPGYVSIQLGMCCGSMRPALYGGETVFVSPPLPSEDLLGHIVIRDDGITHRVTAQNVRAVYTAGDANQRSDGWYPRSQIVWVIRYVLRQ